MTDRIGIKFAPAQTIDFFATLRARLENDATFLYERPVTGMENSTRSKYKLPLHSIDVIIESHGTVEIKGSASRCSGHDSPARLGHFRRVCQSDVAQASLLLYNASLLNAIGALVRQVIPEIDDATIGNAVVDHIDIPINLSCPQAPLEAILSAAASSRPEYTLVAYGHGKVRNLSIKGFKRELVLYNKALQMFLRDFSLARLELRIKGAHTVCEVLTGTSAPWGSRVLRVRDLDVVTLYRALAALVHDLVGDRREALDVAGGNLAKVEALELIAAEAARQGMLFDGMTVPVFLAHATPVRTANSICRRLMALHSASFNLDDIIPRDHWNSNYIVPDVLSHLAANRNADCAGPQRSEGREVGV